MLLCCCISIMQHLSFSSVFCCSHGSCHHWCVILIQVDAVKPTLRVSLPSCWQRERSLLAQLLYVCMWGREVQSDPRQCVTVTAFNSSCNVQQQRDCSGSTAQAATPIYSLSSCCLFIIWSWPRCALMTIFTLSPATVASRKATGCNVVLLCERAVPSIASCSPEL